MYYRSRITEESKFCPIFCPCATLLPCCLIGKSITIMRQEDHICCEIGNSGCFYCCFSLFCMCPCTSISLRSQAKKMYTSLPDDSCDTCFKGCCFPFSIFQLFVSLEVWELERKHMEKKKRDMENLRQPNTNQATKLVLKHFDQSIDMIPTSQLDKDDDIKSKKSNKSVKDEDDDDKVKSRKPSSKSRGGDNDDDDDRSTRSKQRTLKSIPSNEYPDMAVIPSVAVLKVTIPPNHFEGSTFIVANARGQEIMVKVPKGGKPGMRMEIPDIPESDASSSRGGAMGGAMGGAGGGYGDYDTENTYRAGGSESSSNPEKEKKTHRRNGSSGDKKKYALEAATAVTPPRKTNGNEQKRGLNEVMDTSNTGHLPAVVTVTIPPNHFEGSSFIVTNTRGEEMLVTVPAGGRPGMKMNIPSTARHVSNLSLSAVDSRNSEEVLLGGGNDEDDDDDATGGSLSVKKERRLRVTIPPDHFEGSAFIVTSSRGEVVVTVPKGGKPGMKMDVPLP